MRERLREKQLLELLSDHPHQTFKAKELARRLGIPVAVYRDFKKLLRMLVTEGKIYKYKKSRYGVGKKVTEVEGELQVKTQGYGFLRREDGGEDIFISEKNMGTAFHGDRVRVQLLAHSVGKSPEGVVVEVLQRARKNIVGTYRKGRRYSFVVPDNIKILRDIYVAEENALNAQPGQKVVVQIENWNHEALNPEGRIVEVLGYPEEPGVDVLSVARAFDLPAMFPKEVEHEVQQISGTIPAAEYQTRLDLREEICFTIDPEDSKDFDDAVSLKLLDNGNYLLGVHIADVSYYVPQGSRTDEEALKRGTSVYLVDRVVPMLPQRLSNELCSLKPHEDRLTFSVLMEVTPKGEVKDYSFRETIIRSCRRFTYEEVQDIIEGNKPVSGKDSSARDGELSPTILNMYELSQVLIKKRRRLGSLDFDLPEVKVLLDEAGVPYEMYPEKRLDSHRLIEEFMLLANQTVARHVGFYLKQDEQKTLPFIYRIHEKPDREKLQDFSEFVLALGYDFKPTQKLTPKMFQQLLHQVEGHDEKVIIEDVLLRSLMKAKYATQNVGHFGLAFKYYTHFTSPIRRYPDLMVHRLLKAYLNGAGHPIDLKRLSRICQISSNQEVVAQEAERESIKIKQVEFMERHLGQEFQGIISGVVPFGIFVEIPRYLVEGLVHVSDLANDYFVHDEKRFCLTGQYTGKVYRLGDPVRVRVKRVSRAEKIIDFVLV